MKILKNIAIKKIDRDTKHIFNFIDGLPNDSIKNHCEINCAIGQLNNLRDLLGLPKLFISFRPVPRPKEKPKKGCIHKYVCIHDTKTTPENMEHAVLPIHSLVCIKCGNRVAVKKCAADILASLQEGES